MRESYTAVIERNVAWTGDFASEPYEAAWAGEALFFARTLDAATSKPIEARVQISPDGMRWVDEGTVLSIPDTPGMAACKVSHFGGWLRMAGTVPDGDKVSVILYLCLKA